MAHVTAHLLCNKTKVGTEGKNERQRKRFLDLPSLLEMQVIKKKIIHRPIMFDLLLNYLSWFFLTFTRYK